MGGFKNQGGCNKHENTLIKLSQKSAQPQHFKNAVYIQT